MHTIQGGYGCRPSFMGGSVGSGGPPPGKFLPKMILLNEIWAYFQQALCKSVHGFPTLFFLLYFNHRNFVIIVTIVIY